MMVYVAQDGDDVVLGVYASLDAAMAAHTGQWQQRRADCWFNGRDQYSPDFKTITAFALQHATGSSLSTADRRCVTRRAADLDRVNA